MNRLLTTTWSGIRRLVKGRPRDRQFDHPEAHRQEPNRFARTAHICNPPLVGNPRR
ncbi:hypothetical protein ACIA8O_31630 [Kitasatospora sp. NPDC051853]|uniref:hypothetical protein n=1 Tax=Kitasatospora sp. NPDC051853 TaxID=3364058 RepID=UPI003790C0A3